MFIGRTDIEAETPILWPPDAESWLIWKDPDAGKDWRQEEKGTTEDEMVGWHHEHNGHGFGWTLGVGDGQGGLAYCGSWSSKESDITEWLKWTEHIGPYYSYMLDPVILLLCAIEFGSQRKATGNGHETWRYKDWMQHVHLWNFCNVEKSIHDSQWDKSEKINA